MVYIFQRPKDVLWGHLSVEEDFQDGIIVIFEVQFIYHLIHPFKANR